MKRQMIPATLLAALAAITAGPAAGAEPDWPCIQRRVPQLSLAQVWAGPLPDAAAEALAQTPEIEALAARLALRRTPMAEAEALIDAFAKDHDAVALVALYAATFEQVNRARSQIIEGIGRYARKQAALDEEIKTKRREFERLNAAEPPDFDAIDAAERDVDWSLRIFQDRQQSLTYVCETPVILEQRAFALGRAVAAQLPKDAP